MRNSLLYWPEAEEDPVISRIVAESRPDTEDPDKAVQWEPFDTDVDRPAEGDRSDEGEGEGAGSEETEPEEAEPAGGDGAVA